MPKTIPEPPELGPDALPIQVILAGTGPPKTRGLLMETLGASGSALICSVPSRQTETQAAKIRQLPFLAVIGLIKKPHAARFQAPSTDLRDLLIAWLSPKDTAERRLYLPLIRPASLRSGPNRLLLARFHHPTLSRPQYHTQCQRRPQRAGEAVPPGNPPGLTDEVASSPTQGQLLLSLHRVPGTVPSSSNTF